MKGFVLTILCVIFLSGVRAKPVGDQDCNRKGKYYQVNCAEQLQFLHPQATCYMNDNGDFFIMTLDRSKDISSTDTTSVQDLWTDSPLNENAAASGVDGKAPATKKDQALVADTPEAETDNSGALLLGLLAIAVLAG